MEVVSRVSDEAQACRKLAKKMILQALGDIKARRWGFSVRWCWQYAYDWVMSEDFEWWCDIAGWNAWRFRAGVKRQAGADRRKSRVWSKESGRWVS